MLQWQHDWGTGSAHWERMLEKGRRVPDGFLDRPEILPVAMFHWAAFCDLESERRIGMVAGPIPRSAARDYALEHGIDDADDLAEFWSIIARLDGAASKLRRAQADPDDAKLVDKVSATDGEGVRNMMRRLSKPRRK